MKALLNNKIVLKKISGILVLVAVFWLLISALSPTTPLPPEANGSTLILIENTAVRANSGLLTPIEGEIWWMAEKYGIDYDLMYDLAVCESSLIHEDRWGDYSSSTDSYLAYGIYQWHQDSWDGYNKLFEVDLDRAELIDQIEMTALVLSSEGQHNWKECWQKITKVAYDN